MIALDVYTDSDIVGSLIDCWSTTSYCIFLVGNLVVWRSKKQEVVTGPLCHEAKEDCCHLFFQCPLVQAAWRAVGAGHLVTSSDEEFWNSVSGGIFRRETEWRRI